MAQSLTHSQLLTNDLISGKPVTKILDLGQHAYADTFVREDQLNLSEPVFPLQVYLNEETGQVQLGYISNAEDRYNLYSYSYTSSNSKFARDHWDDYANWAKAKFTNELVVEIGSNDGYLVSQFKSDKTKILGIDSSATMCEIAEHRGIPSINAVFNSSVGIEVRNQHGLADLVIANNVFNHSNDPVDFAFGVRNMLKDTGVFVFELPYWGDTVVSGRFDQIYHEHISYFTVKSAYHLLKAADMRILDVEWVDYHGGSIRVTACKGFMEEVADSVAEMISMETMTGLFDVEFYKNMQHNLEVKRDQWLQEFYRIRCEEPDAVIIGVGAAAKANTWLTFHRLDKTVINYITDASAHKQGKYTPLTRIPVVSDEEFAKHENPYALILSWNISSSLKEVLLKINPNIRFITQ